MWSIYSLYLLGDRKHMQDLFNIFPNTKPNPLSEKEEIIQLMF